MTIATLVGISLAWGRRDEIMMKPVEAQDLSITGEWSSLQDWPVTAVHDQMLPTGKVLFWGFSDEAWLWDPATAGLTPAARAGFNIFCTGHSFLPDGRILVTGGHVSNGVGLSTAAIYDPANNSWVRLSNMNAGRWYPTNTTLANGDVLVVSGDIDTVQGVNRLPQLWQAATGQWRDLTTAQLALPLYPYMHVAPNGRVFASGPSQTTRYLDTSGSGSWSVVANSAYGYRDYGSSVLYDAGKVLLVGGGDPPTNTAEVIDLNAGTPAWRFVPAMKYTRRQLNATLLPDGTVLVTGGSSSPGFNDPTGAVYAGELWNPVANTWTTVASFTKYRGYHSFALLLPDGRVLSGGGDDNKDAEVYSPGYLFKGPRPVITSAPDIVRYGGQFFVGTTDQISRVTLVRLSSVTHDFNMDQRINNLSFSPTANGLNIAGPVYAELSPPGYYMLFILNNSGVPSVAAIVKVEADALTPPEAPSHLRAARTADGLIDLNWTDHSSNERGFQIERCSGVAGVACTEFTEIARTGPNATTYGDAGAGSVTAHSYRVRAFNGAGVSVYSNVATVPPLIPLLGSPGD
jgi:galactose oxidase-like protein/glyoxal oxidase-like protein